MTLVWFIRHAECEINVGMPTSSPFTAQLTPTGVVQAHAIAWAVPWHPDLIVTSSYARARQTAVPMLQRFPQARYEEWPVHEFTYLAHPTVRKRTTIVERRVLVERYWARGDRYYVDGQGAEAFVDFMRRVYEILERLRYAEEDFIVIFSHGQFMVAVLAWLLGSIGDDMWRFRDFMTANEIPNGAIMQLWLQKNQEIQCSPFVTSHIARPCISI